MVTVSSSHVRTSSRSCPNFALVQLLTDFGLILTFVYAASSASVYQYVAGQAESLTGASYPDSESLSFESLQGQVMSDGSHFSDTVKEAGEDDFVVTVGVGHDANLGRKLLAEKLRSRDHQSMSLNLLHRHHRDSPVKNTHRPSNDSDSLKDRVDMDVLRVHALTKHVWGKVQEHNRKLEGQKSKYSGSPYNFQAPVVSGNSAGSGQYFVDFYLGTPPQKFSLIVDTGSDLIWVQCMPCTTCYPQWGSLFSSAKSSTYHPLSCASNLCQLITAPENFTCDFRRPGVCDYAYGYADQSLTQGVFATETATMNASNCHTVTVPKIAFGCGTFNIGPSFTGAAGVLGLGKGPLSFTSQLGSTFGNMFSYCLVSYREAQTVSSTLFFGDEGKQSVKAKMQFTRLVQNIVIPSLYFYYVQIESVCVAGNMMPIPPQLWKINNLGYGGTIVDSGTTLTVLLEPAYLLVLGAFQQAIPFPRVPSVLGLDLCFDTTHASSVKLPSFTISFAGGAMFKPPSSNLFVKTGENTLCLAMMGSASPFGVNILGNVLQQNYHILYDLDGQRLGFARQKCSAT